MKSLKGVGLCLAMIAALAASRTAHAGTVGFEERDPGAVEVAPIIGLYNDFVWGGDLGIFSWYTSVSDSSFFPGVDAHSGNVYAFNNAGQKVAIYRVFPASPSFTINSLWARLGSGPAAVVSVSGWSGPNIPYNQQLTLTDQWQLYSLNFVGIDMLMIYSGGPTVLFDDITYDERAVTVPLGPASPLLTIIFGVVGLLGLRYIKKSPALVAA